MLLFLHMILMVDNKFLTNFHSKCHTAKILSGPLGFDKLMLTKRSSDS